MRRNVFTILLLAFALQFFASCGDGGSSQSGGILSFDQTEEAKAKIIEANAGLKQIKQHFKEGEEQKKILKQAMAERNEAKVKEICDNLVTQINNGIEIGEVAIGKIREARDMNINDDFKEYLRLKIDCLEKYVTAYEKRREAAILLRDGYDPKNAFKKDQFTVAAEQKEEEVKVIMEEARQSSQEANELAMETLRRKN